MYLPIVEPRQCPGLWQQTSNRSHTLKLRPRSSANHNRNATRNEGGGHPGDMVKTIEVPGIDEHEQMYEERMRAVRMVGWDYIRPYGIGKTMQQMMEEQEDFTDHEVDDEEAIEDHLIQDDVEDSEFDFTNGNVMEPMRIEGNTTEDTTNMTANARVQNDEEDEETDSLGEEEDEELDLDAEIAEAGDNEYDYDDEYDEEDYDEGFVAEEEYDDENELNIPAEPSVVEAAPNANALKQLAEQEQNLQIDVSEGGSAEYEEEDEGELLFNYNPVDKPDLEEDEGEGEGDMSF